MNSLVLEIYSIIVKDAIIIDSTILTVEEIVEKILDHLKNKQPVSEVS